MRVLWAAVLISFLVPATWAQGAPQTSQSPSTPAQPQKLPEAGSSPAQQVPGAGATVQDKSQPQKSPGEKQPQASQEEQPQPETRITKEQAKELFRSVDEILHFASVDTLLPIERKVKRNLITREEVEKYVDKRMKDDRDTKRLE